MTYEIILINEKEKLYKIINWLLLAVNFISVLLFAFSIYSLLSGSVIFALLAVLSIIITLYFKRNYLVLAYGLAFFHFSMAWFISGFWLIGVLNLFFMVLSVNSLKKPLVYIDEEIIIYPSLFNRKINWNELNNVILKDDLLTIDFKSNKLIQQLTDESITKVDEKEFNDFCKSKLSIQNSE